jgi:hypothetical protein
MFKRINEILISQNGFEIPESRPGKIPGQKGPALKGKNKHIKNGIDAENKKKKEKRNKKTVRDKIVSQAFGHAVPLFSQKTQESRPDRR